MYMHNLCACAYTRLCIICWRGVYAAALQGERSPKKERALFPQT